MNKIQADYNHLTKNDLPPDRTAVEEDSDSDPEETFVSLRAVREKT